MPSASETVEPPPAGEEQTFLFADLAGFTALTEAHGDERAADLATDFCEAVRTLLPDHGAAEVKTIGDAMLIRGDDAGQAVRLGLRIANRVGARHGFPDVRVGMHTGPAVQRGGDWFGTTVNLAARVSALAGGGEVLLTEATRASGGELDGVELRGLGPHRFRNMTEPVGVYQALESAAHGGDDLPIDPVCRMAVSPLHCAGSLSWRGSEFRFCSLDCAAAFAAAPDRFIDMQPQDKEDER